MTPPLFLAATAELAGDRVTLSGPEGHHAARVRRVSAGEAVEVTDGEGLLVSGRVAVVSGDTVSVDVVARRRLPPPAPRLVVVQALPKGERGELAVELMTEVGVDVVVPWAAARCVVQWRGERGARARSRWAAHAREAGKQAHRAWLPRVTELASTADVSALLAPAAVAVVLHESASVPLSRVALPRDGDVVLVVGPEGGLTDDEVAGFAAAGAQACRLGDTVLRTSTAGVAAAAVVLARSGRWG